MKWFRNLKKWQKGGLIGLGIGLIFACILMITSPGGEYRQSLWEWTFEEWVANFHGVFLS